MYKQLFTRLKNVLRTREVSNWEELYVSSKSFSKAEKRISKRTRKAYKYENKLFVKCLDLHTDSIGYAYDLVVNNADDLFYDAFVRLSVKILHNAEAIRNLVNMGLYGSGNMIYRSLIFDTFMIWYLYFNPDLISDWTKETFSTYKDSGWRNKFSEKTIIENLKEKGKRYRLNCLDYETDFTFYSKVGHPSYFSIRFFQNDSGALSYLPEFSMKRGHLLLNQVLGLLLYPTQALLEKDKEKTKEKSKLSGLRQRYNDIMPVLNKLGKIVADFHKNVLGAKNAKDVTRT